MKKILFIEDDQVVATIYRNKFSLEGFRVEVASDGETGAQMVESFQPDVIVLDLMLPKLPGIEVVKRIRSLPKFAHTPILVFSNTYLTNLVMEARKAGATKCLSKSSCTPRHLLEAVRASLEAPESRPAAQDLAEETPKAPPESATPSDEAFQDDLRQEFVAGLPATLIGLREGLKKLAKAENDTARIPHFQGLYQLVHPLTGNAALAGLTHIAQMAAAFEVLLKELSEKPKNLNTSSMRTVTSAVDFLGFLFQNGVRRDKQVLPPPRILVVDDEAISRRAVVFALEKARLKCESCESPLAALELLEAGQFDLVFLDVDMPGMNGFELCTKLRAQPQHKKTPVVFVTSLNDLENRANSMMSGGNDFIGKPFPFIELAVKAVMHIQRGRLTPAN